MDPPPSLWLDEPHRPRAPPRGRLAADVAVVGGGIAGVAAAQALAGRGLSVALLEADALASRASGRNAGFVISSLAESYAHVAQARGRAFAREVWRVNEANRERLAGLVRDLRLDCAFERPGAYCAAGSPGEAAELEASAAMLRQDGFDFRWVPPGEARGLLGPAGAHGALFRPGDGSVHPARLVRRLAAAAEAAGARIHEGARVVAMEAPRGAGPWRLAGEGWSVEADRVVLAANAFSPALHPWFGAVLAPVRGQVLATAPLRALPQVPAPVYHDRGYDYWRLHGGRLVLGGRRPVARQEEVGLDERPNPRVQAALDALLARMFPGLAAQVTHRWAGIMDFSVDGFPFVGPVPGEERLLTAVGFTGHGLGYAVECAAWLAAALLHGKDEVPAPFRSGRAVPAGPVPF